MPSTHEHTNTAPDLTDSEIVAFLTELLESERAGAKVALHMVKEAIHDEELPHVGAALGRVRVDEAHSVNVLAHHLKRYHVKPSDVTGPFKDKVLAQPDLSTQVALLNRGQLWVVRKLRENLPRIKDPLLQRDLQEMLEVHEENIATCEHLI